MALRALDESGKRLAEWAAGGKAKESAAAAPGLPTTPSQEGAGAQTVADLITADQAIDIGDKLSEAGIAKERFLKATKVASIGMLPAAAYARAVDWIQKAGAK